MAYNTVAAWDHRSVAYGVPDRGGSGPRKDGNAAEAVVQQEADHHVLETRH